MGELFVQRLIERRHFYSAAAITAHFVADMGGGNMDAFEAVNGTVFIVRHNDVLFFVTNRHVLEYNYKPPRGNQVPSAQLKSIEIRGHAQPQVDSSETTVPWSYAHPGTGGVVFHQDEQTDLAVVAARLDAFNINPVFAAVLGYPPHVYDFDWLATASELDLLSPGDQVLITGHPGIAGSSDRPVLVSGIVASDPRYPASFGNAQLGPHATLCHSFSWAGMSGAPVLGFSEAIGHTKIVGINAGHVNGSGIAGGVISHFVRSSALIELIQGISQ